MNKLISTLLTLLLSTSLHANTCIPALEWLQQTVPLSTPPMMNKIVLSPMLPGLHMVGTPLESVYSPFRLATKSGIKKIELGKVVTMDRTGAEMVLISAKKAWNRGLGEWPLMSPKKRIEAIRKAVELMKPQRSVVSELLQYEIAKTKGDAEKEFDRTIEYIEATLNAYERMIEVDESTNRLSGSTSWANTRRPHGITLVMGPYNYPFNETITNLIPALLTGNPVIFKPARIGILFWHYLLPAFKAALPEDVLNTVYGDGKEVISPLLQSGHIDTLAFIGSDTTSKILLSQAPNLNSLRAVLGLGAKNPAIILSDADMDVAVRENVLGAFSYCGQRCTAHKVVYVHRSRATEFIQRFSDAVDNLKMGYPWEDGVKITPLPEDNKDEFLFSLVADALSKGGKISTSRPLNSRNGFFTPIVLSNVSPSMRIFNEEQFGPVAPIVVFDNVEEVIHHLSRSPFGQQAAVFSSETPSAELETLIQQLGNLVCRVNFNGSCQRGPDDLPFAARKNSGAYVLSIKDALLAFTDPFTISGKASPNFSPANLLKKDNP